MYPFRRILIGTDFGPSSQRAVELAAAIAATHGSELLLVHAFEVLVPMYPIAIAPPVDTMKAAAEEAMQIALQELRARLPNVAGFVRHGNPHNEIIACAKEQSADLIVVGTHGHRGLSRALLGSEAEKVVRFSTIPVLTVRAEESAAGAQAA